ncbi:MAG: HepT-like ribonuclease domain-containing protein [Nocardioidaceae bacterium]
MSRHDDERLADIVASADAIASHLRRGRLDDGLVFDAVRVRLIEIGEAVKDIEPALLATEPDIPWRDVARMRDHLAHRYFDTAHGVVQATVDHDLPAVVAAAHRMLHRLGPSPEPPDACLNRGRQARARARVPGIAPDARRVGCSPSRSSRSCRRAVRASRPGPRLQQARGRRMDLPRRRRPGPS